MHVGLVLRLIEVLRVLHEAAEALEEGHEDGSVSVAMVSSRNHSHHVGHFNLVLTILAHDDGALLSGADAKVGKGVHRRAQRGKAFLETHTADVR